jgi:uncharacterized protein (TIGR00251 family)
MHGSVIRSWLVELMGNTLDESGDCPELSNYVEDQEMLSRRVEDTIREVPGGVEITLRCQPGAARSGFVGLHGDALKVKVRAPALTGRANKELISLISNLLGTRSRDVSLVSGERSRIKRVRVEGVSPLEVAEILRGALSYG